MPIALVVLVVLVAMLLVSRLSGRKVTYVSMPTARNLGGGKAEYTDIQHSVVHKGS